MSDENRSELKQNVFICYLHMVCVFRGVLVVDKSWMQAEYINDWGKNKNSHYPKKCHGENLAAMMEVWSCPR